jgi:putative oxidoreductase
MDKICEFVKQYGPLGGRILLALVFVTSGWDKLMGFEATAGYIASKGLPLPQLGAAIAIAVELVGGIMLIVGWQTRWAAAAIFLFLIPTTLIFHAYWAVDAAQQSAQQIQFMKNLCIMGGMLYVMAFGAGAFSIDNRKS